MKDGNETRILSDAAELRVHRDGDETKIVGYAIVYESRSELMPFGFEVLKREAAYVVQWPRQADKAEQLLGRTHRNGQTADELRVVRGDYTEFDFINFAACLNDALYIHQTTGTRQKMIYCNYDPLPKIFPSSVLRERGAEVRRLTIEQRKMMADKFGDYT